MLHQNFKSFDHLNYHYNSLAELQLSRHVIATRLKPVALSCNSGNQCCLPTTFPEGTDLNDIIKGFVSSMWFHWHWHISFDWIYVLVFLHFQLRTVIHLPTFWKVKNCSLSSQDHYKQCQYAYRFWNHLASMVLEMPQPNAHSFHSFLSLRCPWQAPETQNEAELQASLAWDKLSSGRACLEPSFCASLSTRLLRLVPSRLQPLSLWLQRVKLSLQRLSRHCCSWKLLWWLNRAFSGTVRWWAHPNCLLYSYPITM